MVTKVKLIADDIVSTDHLDPSASLTFTDLTLTGNLTVQGTTTTLDTTNLNVEDKNITLNYGTGDTSSGVDGAGITIQDAVDASNDATFNWSAANDRFKLSHGLEVTTGDVHIGPLTNTGSTFHLSDSTGNTGIGIDVPNTTSTSYIDFGDTDVANSGNIEYIHSTDTMNFKTAAALAIAINNSQDVAITGKMTAGNYIVNSSDPAQTTNPAEGVGTVWVNSTSGDVYVCTDATSNANYWTNIGTGTTNVGFAATGGNSIVTSGGYKYHIFTSSGSLVVTGTKSAQALIIGGGGGGGGLSANGGGGGGAGGVVLGAAITLTSQTYSITVGTGGAGGVSGSNGGNSSFPGETVAVGGGGGGTFGGAGSSGGSGGGGGRDSNTSSGGAGTAGQGNAGGGAGGVSCASAGGGGGAGQVGQQGGTDCGAYTSGMSDGGDGTSTYSAWGAATNTGVNVSGTYYYAGGGGGAMENPTSAGIAVGGLGGGGNGANGQTTGAHAGDGVANTGSGGGGGQNYASNQKDPGDGADGIVIVRYAV